MLLEDARCGGCLIWRMLDLGEGCLICRMLIWRMLDVGMPDLGGY
jgi:hypothetical protein